jgi:hypothetical protein
MMKKQTPHITDEHIVAYLDGELHVSADFERDLRADPSLHMAASEYTAISKAIAVSAGDKRFMLTSQIDARAKKVLGSITKSRKVIRKTVAAPNAVPSRTIPAQRSIKYLWAKRAGIGLAFASLLALLWINTGTKNEQLTQVPVPSPRTAPVPAIEAPAPSVTTQVVPPKTEMALNSDKSNHPVQNTVQKTSVVKNSADNNLASNTAAVQTPHASATEAAANDPAAIMISHRYAKMIKSTPVVEVTQQDRLGEQDQM